MAGRGGRPSLFTVYDLVVVLCAKQAKKKNLVEIMSTYFEIRVFVHVGACLIKTKQLLRR